MNIILLSGGSGKRLWPLSNDVRSKQFIKFLKNESGEYESMVQRVFRQIKDIDPYANIVIATSKSQASMIRNQLGESVNISIEPSRRDTFPAIVLACSYLVDVCHVNKTEPVIVCPIDSFVEKQYFQAFLKMHDLVKKAKQGLVLLGLTPTESNDKFGYIIPETVEDISEVVSFVEKPPVDEAKYLISKGALWNGGVFAFCLNYLIEKSHEMIDFIDYFDLFDKYETLEKISFDYAFVEKEKNIKVIKYCGVWKDIGTWSALVDSLEEKSVGNVIIGKDCEDVSVINELPIPIIATGLKNLIISSSPEGVLVSSKEASSNIKQYVDEINQKVMFAEKSWGNYQIINIEETSLTLKVVLNPGHSMHYHSHQKKDEVWIVVEGKGEAVIDGKKIEITPGSVVELKSGVKHMAIAITKLVIIEVQMGDNVSSHDKIKHDF